MRAHRLLGCCAALLALTACSGGDDTAETPVLELTDEGPGTCLQVEDDLPPEVARLPVIECSEPHTHEIYAVVDWDGTDVFPGIEALTTFAEQVCVREFEPYVGISAFDSRLLFTWLVPTLGSWNDDDDRATLCVLSDVDNEPLTGSMKDSKR